MKIYVKEEKIKDFYEKESKKLVLISDQYPHEFISCLGDIMKTHYISFDELMDILPQDTFFKPTMECDIQYWAKYSDYMFIYGLLKGSIKLEDYEDADYIDTYHYISQTDRGIMDEKKYTSFTKREYLEQIGKKEKVKKLEK